ncbi:MAG: hypothetical protein ACRDPL_00505, partial [Propionibacteriaceae bacterium]
MKYQVECGSEAQHLEPATAHSARKTFTLYKGPFNGPTSEPGLQEAIPILSRLARDPYFLA